MSERADQPKDARRRLDLSDWSKIADIAGMVAVVISLVFVAYSIQKNTEELQKKNAQQLYEAIREIEVAVLGDEELQRVIWAIDDGRREELDDFHLYRFRQYLVQVLTVWEQAHSDFLVGTMSDEDYEGWREFFEDYMGDYMIREDWEADKRWLSQFYTVHK